jgi:hypothetical protein
MSFLIVLPDRRKWLKFVAVHGRYEKSVKVCKDVSLREYGDLANREVLAERPKFRRGVVSVNGYYRVRTDREYYPVCGIYGIPDDRLSGLSKEFAAYQIKGIRIGSKIKWDKKYEAEKKARKMKADEDRRYARNIPNWDLAARMKIPVALATPEMLSAKRNQIATLRAIKEIKKQINENTNE